MPYRQNVQYFMQSEIGDRGLSESDLESMRAPARLALYHTVENIKDPAYPLFSLPQKIDDMPSMIAVADHFRSSFSDVVVLGTGGSSLGAKAVAELSAKDGGPDSPNLHVDINIDQYGFANFVNNLPLSTTGWIIVSKSGGTAETLMQFMSILPKLRAELGDSALPKHIVVITERRDSALMRLANVFNLPVLEHDPKIGGRYSVLSVVGMLPALIVGLDPSAFRAGAAEVVNQVLSVSPSNALEADPILGAVYSQALYEQKGIANTVVIAYGDKFESFCRWYRQLWAESLGKNGRGTTPSYGMGPVDQHSQLQLWLDGPGDKMFTILGTCTRTTGIAPSNHQDYAIDPDIAAMAGMDFMAGHRLEDLMDACRLGTTQTLAQYGCPVRTMDVDHLDEYSLGGLLMHFMIETIAASALMKVNPFDQPAVEHGKLLAKQYLCEERAGKHPAALQMAG